jgi:glycosyltransferase involved in cell wall biosynthesis
MLFSIIIPFYNTIEYIDDVLKSILNQQYFNITNIQVIFVNDGSSHDIAPKLIAYQKIGLNIELFNKNNGNWGSVINYVKHNKLAIGDYITVLDSDDVLTNNCFSNTYLYLQKHKVDILVGDLSQ